MKTVLETSTSSTNSAPPVWPFLDLHTQYQSIKSELEDALLSVMESQRFILGPEVQSLETEIAEYAGVQFAVGCASGSDALLLALMALKIGPGDEVITTPFTFVATAGAVARLGARPVFVDIDRETYNLAPNRIETVITPKTKAIIPVHLFGMPAEMDAIMEIATRRGIAVVEDAAQAIGSRYHGRPVGSMGLCGCFSFFPSKNLGGAGDGGMLTTNDAGLADRLRMLRTHGSRSKYEYDVVGINSRLDTLQAAILRVKFRHLDSWAKLRRQNALNYSELFNNTKIKNVIMLPQVSDNCEHVYNQYVIRTPKRDELKNYLSSHGLPTEIYYPKPLHLQRAFEYLGYKAGDMPESEAASREVLALPIFAEMPHRQQELTVDAIASFCSKY